MSNRWRWSRCMRCGHFIRADKRFCTRCDDHMMRKARSTLSPEQKARALAISAIEEEERARAHGFVEAPAVLATIETRHGLGDEANRSCPTPFDLLTDLLRDGPTDPLVRLGTVGLLQRWLDDQEASYVRAARTGGASWSAIGEQLGRSRQSLARRHRPDAAAPPQE